MYSWEPYNIKFSFRGHCAIGLDDYVVVVGKSVYATSIVEKYDVNGFVEEFPSLLQKRSFCGCSHYISSENQLVKGTGYTLSFMSLCRFI